MHSSNSIVFKCRSLKEMRNTMQLNWFRFERGFFRSWFSICVQKYLYTPKKCMTNRICFFREFAYRYKCTWFFNDVPRFNGKTTLILRRNISIFYVMFPLTFVLLKGYSLLLRMICCLGASSFEMFHKCPISNYASLKGYDVWV